MDIMQEIGEKISTLRKQKGMTQRDLADILHVSDKNVSKWECGRSVPDIFYLKQLADVFGVTVDYFIDQSDVKEAIDENKLKRTRSAKISFTILLIFALAPLLVTVIARIFLPETVPCHFDADWTVTRWGSSKELVIMGGSFFCIIATAAVALCYAFVKIDNAEIRQWTVWLAFGVFAAMAVAMTAIGADIVKRCYDLALAEGYTVADYSKFNKLFSVIIVVLFAVCGALCIFVPQNAVIGVRIPYSYKGKEEWAFVNGVTGAVMYVVSVAMLVTIGSVDGPAGFGLVGAALFAPVAEALVASFVSVSVHKKIKGAKTLYKIDKKGENAEK